MARRTIDCCRYCKTRYVGCHSECPEYIKESKELQDYRKLCRDADVNIYAEGRPKDHKTAVGFINNKPKEMYGNANKRH